MIRRARRAREAAALVEAAAEAERVSQAVRQVLCAAMVRNSDDMDAIGRLIDLRLWLLAGERAA